MRHCFLYSVGLSDLFIHSCHFSPESICTRFFTDSDFFCFFTILYLLDPTILPLPPHSIHQMCVSCRAWRRSSCGATMTAATLQQLQQLQLYQQQQLQLHQQQQQQQNQHHHHHPPSSPSSHHPLSNSTSAQEFSTESTGSFSDGVGSRSSSSCTVYNPLSLPAVPVPTVPTVLSPPGYSHQLPLNQQQQPGPHQQHHHHHYSHHYPYLRKMIIGEDEGELVEDVNLQEQQLQTPTSTTGDLLMGLSDMDIPLVDGDEEDEEEDNCPLLEAEQLTSLQSNTTLTTSSTTAGDVTLLITVDDDGERGPNRSNKPGRANQPGNGLSCGTNSSNNINNPNNRSGLLHNGNNLEKVVIVEGLDSVATSANTTATTSSNDVRLQSSSTSSSSSSQQTQQQQQQQPSSTKVNNSSGSNNNSTSNNSSSSPSATIKV